MLEYCSFTLNHSRIQKVLSEGVQLDKVFFVKFDERRKDPNTTISGPSTARQRNAFYRVSLAGR